MVQMALPLSKVREEELHHLMVILEPTVNQRCCLLVQHQPQTKSRQRSVKSRLRLQAATRSCLESAMQGIEGANQKQEVAAPVRRGQHSLLTGTPPPQKSTQMLDWSQTTAAIQMAK